jgi:hypothetical protein
MKEKDDREQRWNGADGVVRRNSSGPGDDNLVRGVPKRQLWIAAAPPDQAVQLVLAVIPEGWTARLADGHLTAREVQLLKLPPGEVRELTE